jgi:hypothetical protein
MWCDADRPNSDIWHLTIAAELRSFGLSRSQCGSQQSFRV